jgi:hypothetical protein
MLRIILHPAFDRHGKRLHGRSVATLDGRQLCVSRQPLLDSARILIVEGVDPARAIRRWKAFSRWAAESLGRSDGDQAPDTGDGAEWIHAGGAP